MSSISIKSNIVSLSVQRRLAESTSMLEKSLQRLSSGQRINRARDDAAGLAIADNLRAESRLYGTAARNINDGLSLLNIITSALEEQSNILIRLGELAEQSANGAFSDNQRTALNGEYQALLQEFDRIAETTQFNGISPLMGAKDGNSSEILLQVGISGEEFSRLGFTTEYTGANSGVLGVSGDYIDDEGVDAFDTAEILSWEPNIGHSFDEIVDFFGPTISRAEVIDSDGQEREILLVPAVLNFGGGSNISVWVFGDEGLGGYTEVGVAANQPVPFDQNIALTFDDSGATANIRVDLSQLDLQHSDIGPAPRKTAIGFTGVESTARALDALEVTRNRLEDLSKTRGRFGAVQSRLETALKVVYTARESTIAAESQIRDADIAHEAAQLVRARILQQAAAAVLAQANQQPANALKLLE